MTEPKEASIIFILHALKGGVVNKPDVALKIAEILIADHYGADELAQQQPLVVMDQSETWLIEGSRNKDRRIEGRGSANVVISKRNGRILDIAVPEIRFAHPDVKNLLNKPQ